MWFLPICGSISASSTNLQLCSNVTFTIEKNPKPALFRGQLYKKKFALTLLSSRHQCHLANGN